MSPSLDASHQHRSAEERGSAGAGKEYEFKIIKISPETRRIGLSYRAAAKQMNGARSTSIARLHVESSSTATIGDALKSKLGR